MIHPVVWKEWREQRWKLAFGTAMLVFFTGSFLAARVSSNREVSVVIWIFGGMLFALYSAMGVFAPERENGTLTFLAAKPIAAWKVFLWKWFFGWLNVAVPMVVCTLGVVAFGMGEGIMQTFDTSRLIRGTVGGIGLATMYYTMVCCLAPRKAGEAMVGFVGLILVVAIFIHMGISTEMIMWPANRPIGAKFSLLAEIIVFINPVLWMAFVGELPEGFRLTVLVVVQTMVFIAVMGFGLRKWKRSF